MKVTAQVICETNKVIIETPFEKFNMEYSDEMGLELFISILLYNSTMMANVAKTKLESAFKDLYGREVSIFVIDGKSNKIIEVSLSDEHIDDSTTEIIKKLSTKNGRLCLR